MELFSTEGPLCRRRAGWKEEPFTKGDLGAERRNALLSIASAGGCRSSLMKDGRVDRGLEGD